MFRFGRRCNNLGLFLSIHEPGPDGRCVGCLAKLSQVHPYLQEWFWEHVIRFYKTAHVSWGYRGQLDQNACVATGSSRLPWPASAHNARVAIDPSLPFDPSNEADPNSKPYARALDVFQISPGSGENGPTAVYSSVFFFALYQDIEQAGLKLLWGGKWPDLGDRDHIQIMPGIEP